MFHIPELCRICLQGEKTLKDITSTEGGTEPLVNKLKLCVPEVEWPINVSIMMCEPCVGRLNNAFDFRKQCLESTQTLQAVSQLVAQSSSTKPADDRKSGYVAIKPAPAPSNNKIPISNLSKILVTAPPITSPTASGGVPNIVVNIIPGNNLKPATITAQAQIPDANRNMFVNINNTLHKVFPVVTQTKDGLITQPVILKSEEMNITQILTESKSEELSVDVDPNIFDCEETTEVKETEQEKDWEDLISSNKIGTDKGQVLTEKIDPLEPKTEMDVDDNYMNFIQSDHFMAPFIQQDCKSFMCEQCGQVCDSLKSLNNHIETYHLGKFPYKCAICSTDYAIGSHYQLHLQKHVMKHAQYNPDTYTLEDLNGPDSNVLFAAQEMNSSIQVSADGTLEGDKGMFQYQCENCPTSFNTPHGLSRHKVRKHNKRKKYFIKGMKNAKCDICNRQFSTQSYLQLHIKLHYRKMDYRLKVFDKDTITKEVKDDAHAQTMKVDSDESCLEIDEDNASDIDESHLSDEIKSLQGQTIDQIMNLKDTADMHPQLLALKVELVKGKAKCVLCHKLMINKEEMIEHINTIHLNAIQYQCHVCKKEFSDVAPLMVHRREHNMFLRCITCNWECDNPTDLSAHLIATHNSEGATYCTGCDRNFDEFKRLKEHLHNSEKCTNMKCHICDAHFDKQSLYVKHMVRHNNMHMCSVCRITFLKAKDLNAHHLTHRRSCRLKENKRCSKTGVEYKNELLNVL